MPTDGPARERDPTPKDFAAALNEIKQWLPEDCIARDKITLLEYGHSEWSRLPGAVLMPRSTEDVVRIVQSAAKHAIPLVPYCGGTSLEGHTSPPVFSSNPEETKQRAKLAKGETPTLEDLSPGLSFLISFQENMGEIVKINADDLDIVVQPGISYDDINEALRGSREQGIPLHFPVDPAPGAQIGGMIGTGTNAVHYGTMREAVINLTVVLPNGKVIKTRQRAKKSSAGPDLGRLFIGAEGTLGIVVEVTLKLYPILPTTVGVVSFPTVQEAADALRDIIQQGVTVSCIELLDDVMLKIINSTGGETHWDEKPSLFFKFAGTPDQMKGDIAILITQKYNGSNFLFSKDDAEAEGTVALWSTVGYIPDAKCWVTDVCVPISNLPQLITGTKVS
ncbi:hypothetical protein RQP46_003547 [Phenoliferia psychrophenolica]